MYFRNPFSSNSHAAYRFWHRLDGRLGMSLRLVIAALACLVAAAPAVAQDESNPPANEPPVVTAPANRTYEQGETITAFGITVTDAENDTVTVTVTGLPTGLSYTSDQVQGTVAPDAAAQDYTVTIAADDGVNAAVTATFDIAVTAVDSVPPTVSIEGPSELQPAGFWLTIVFSEPVTGFEQSDVTVGNGTVLTFSPESSRYRVKIRAASSGMVTVDVNADVAADEAGNGNRAASQFSVESDRVRPQLTITGPAAVQTGPFDVALTFSEPVTGFEQSEVSVSNGTLTAFSGADATYAATIMPAASGTVEIEVAAGVAKDAAGNPNYPASHAQQAALNSPPVPTAPADKTYEQGETITAFGITASDADADTVTVTVTGLPSGLSYASGQVQGTVAADAAAQDYVVTISADDGVNAAVTATFTITVSEAQAPNNVDSADVPAVFINSHADNPTTQRSFNMDIIFSEPVKGFEKEDVTVGNGRVNLFQATGDAEYEAGYYLSIIPTAARGTLTVDVAGGAAVDVDGNGNTAATRYSVELDVPVAALTIADASAAEGDQMTFTVTLDHDMQEGLTVTPSFTNGTATEGTDYAENTADISFSGLPGETRSFTVSTTHDADVEQDETFAVSLSVSDTLFPLTATDTGTGIIIDDDAAIVTIADATAAEGEAMTFTVTLDRALPGGLTVTPSFADNTAASGADYTENAAGLSFTGNVDETRTFTVATDDDHTAEHDETFTVSLAVSGTSERVRASGTATGTIIDDDAAVVTIADATAVEGDAMTFTVTLDRAVQGGLEVTPSFTDNTAASGADYTENTDDITFTGNANETRTFTVSTTHDADPEHDETFAVRLSMSEAPPSVTASGTATGTIVDDDAAVVTIADATAAEGATMTFTVTLDKAVSGGLMVTPSFTDGTAAKGTDYTENTADILFSGNAGETRSFTVSTTQDADAEQDETFAVRLSVWEASPGVTATDTATGTITDDDSAMLTIADAAAAEGDAMTFTVSLDKAVQGGLTVTPSFTDGTAAKGADYSENTGGLTFTGNANETRTFTVSTTEDADIEQDETFTVSLAVSGTQATVTATDTATGAIIDDDAHKVTIADASADEGDAMTFTVTLDKAVSGGLTVTPSFTDGTAIEGTDYTENTAAVSFTGNAGETRTFTVATTDNAVVEGDKSFTVSLTVSGTTEPVTASDTATGTIINDDSADAPAVFINSHADNPTTQRSFNMDIFFSKPVKGFEKEDVTVGNGRVNLFQATGDAEYEAGYYLSIIPTAARGTLTVDVAGGVAVDVDGNGNRAATRYSVELDVPVAALTIADASAAEGDQMTFTVTLDHDMQEGLTVTPSFTNGTATEGTDYAENTADISFSGLPGETRSFTVSTTHDADVEQDETFAVSLSVSDTLFPLTATDTGTGIIIDDDAAIVTIADATAAEGEAMTFTVTLDRALPGGLTVTPSFADNTAASGADYTENAAGLSFTGNVDETRTFTVATDDDHTAEHDETFTVSLAVSGTSERVRASGTATGTIIDDDAAVVTIADATAVEGDAMTFTVTLDRAVQGGLEVTPSFTDNTAASGADYTENTDDITFTGNANETRTFTVSTTEDADPEHDETFAVRLNMSEAPPGVTASGTATGTITDDDSAMLTIADASADEGEVMTFTVTLDKAVPDGLTVTPSFADDTAASGADYTENTAGISFTGNADETRTFTVATAENAVVEGDKNFTVSLAVSGATGPVTASGTATGTIIDDDAAVVTIADATAAEGDAMTFTVTLDKAVRGGLTVTPSFRDVTAAEGTDYTGNTAGIIFSGLPGETRSFTVSTTQDAAAEQDETFAVRLSVSEAPPGVTASGTATGTITDDDSAMLTIADAAAAEGDAMTFTVTLDKAVQGGLTVTPSLTDGTAIESTDYTENKAGVSFTGNANETRTFTVATAEDDAAEHDETFTVSLAVSGTQAPVWATGTATGTIIDDDAAVVRIADATAAEGDAMTFTVTVDKAVQGGLAVTPSFRDGTATEGTDYTENTAAIIFSGNAGETRTFTVSTTEDAAAEQDETFAVRLSVSEAPPGVTATDTATGTITDDDSAMLTITDAAAAEGDEITFTVTLNGAVPGGLTVTPSFTDDTAGSGTDYTENTEGIHFTGNAGETRTFTVSTTDGAAAEQDETFMVSLIVSGTPETVRASDTATGTIIDNDSTAQVTITDASAPEGGTLTFTVTLDAAVPGGLTVTPNFTDGTAAEGTDYNENLGGIRFTGNAGETRSFTVSTTDGADPEYDETFTVTLAVSETSATVRATDTATGTIIDDDAAVVTISDASALEGDVMTFTLTLDKAVPGGLTVTPSFIDDTASGGHGEGGEDSDYIDNLPAIHFTGYAGEQHTVTFVTTEDAVVEGDESFFVQLGIQGPPGGAVVKLGGRATGSIIDDDGSAAVTVADASADEGDKITFTVKLDKAVQGGFTVKPSFTDGTATKRIDYTENIAPFTFTGTANETQIFTVATTEDEAVEADETFKVSLAVAGTQATLTVTGTATGTIIDDDGGAAVTVADASAKEGDPISFTVTLNQAVQGGLTVTPSFTDLTAAKGTDYTGNTAELNFVGKAKETQTFTVATTEDEAVEADETFKVNLAVSGTQAPVTAADTAIGTITDDDSAAVSIADASASEGDAISFTVTLDKAVPGGLTVTPAFTDATAAKGTDYVENPAPLTFTGTANETQTFTVATTEDEAVEADETFTVSLAVSGAQATVTATDTATGTITNDDGSAAVTIADASANEGDAISFTVTLNQAVPGGLMVTPAFTDATAAKGTDYAENPAGINFAGTASETRTFTVSTTEDAVVETDETFTVTLVVSGTQATVTASDTATGTITDDDSAAVSIADASASEGETLSFTVTLDGAVQGGLKVTPAFADATATKGTDYTESTAALNFVGHANESQTFTVATTEDAAVEADETFTVSLAVSGTQATVTATDTATGIITDDDGSAAVTIADASANEGDAISFTVTLNQAVSGGLTVTPAFTDATATKGADYAENPAGISFAGTANETRTFTVSTTEDAVVETDETFTVSLVVSGTQATVTVTDTATGTITDDDSAAVNIADASASEGETLSFTVTLDGAVQGGLKVTPAFADATATKGTDYTESAAALNFVGNANETQTFTVATTEDAVVETDETFTVSLAVSGTQATVTATDTATGTITDYDGGAAVTIADASANEGDAISFAVTLNQAVSGGLTVTPAFTDATATKGADYTENTTELNFVGHANETQTFTVATTEDTAVETDETFTVSLAVSGTQATVMATDTATGTITNDDGSASVTIADASANEGDAISFTVTLDKAVQGGLQVTPVFTDVTATKGTDYTESTAALNFVGHANESQTFTVATTEDAAVEADETFTVSLAVSGTQATVTATDTATGTIINDDGSAAVSIADASANEGDAISFTVTLSQAVSGGLTVTPAFTDATAAKGTDYVENPAGINFAGTASETRTFTVSTTEDAVVETDETFTVTLVVSGTQATVTATDTATGTITDDDSAAVSIADASASEGETLSFTVTLDGAVQGGLKVTPVFTDATATKGTDYTESTAGLNFVGSANESQTFTVATTEDAAVEADETFTVSLAVSGTQATVTATDTATGTIVGDDIVGDDDKGGPPSFDEGDPNAHGGGQTTRAVSENAPPGSPVGEPVTATDPDNALLTYALSGSNAFVIDSETGQIRVAAGAELDYEGDTNTYNATVQAGNAKGDTAIITVTINVMNVNEPPVAIGSMPQQVLLVGASATIDSGPYFLDPDGDPLHYDAQAIDPDIATAVTSSPPVITTAKAEGTTTVVVTTCDPSRECATQSFPVLAIEASISFVPDRLTVTEGDAKPYTVKLQAEPAGPVMVMLTSDDPGAATVSPSELTFTPEAWDTHQRVNVTGVQDSDADDERVIVTHQTSGGGYHMTADFIVTVADDDNPGVTITPTEVAVDEGATVTAAYTVVLDTRPRGDVTVEPASDDSGVATVSPHVLTFTQETWDKPQAVSVTGVTDQDATDATVAVRHKVTGADYTGVAASPVHVRVVDKAESVRVSMASAWLARFGRTVTSQAMDMIGERVRGTSLAGLTLAGRQVGLDTSPLSPLQNRNGEVIARDLETRDLLLQSSFQLALDESHDSAGHAWSVWGRAGTDGFKGKLDGGLLDGTVLSGYLGIDYRFDTGALAGVAVSHSRGTGRFDGPEIGTGEAEAALTSVLPYARWSPRQGIEVWGLVGLGKGDFAMRDASGRLGTDISLLMAALGMRGALPSVSVLDLAVEADGAVTRVASQAVPGLPRLQAGVQRLRLALEGSLDYVPAKGARLTPAFEIGLRHDGGDADTGLGVEIGASLNYVNLMSGLTVALRGRTLVAHQASRYEEWGVSGVIGLDPGVKGQGLALALVPSYGPAASGMQQLLNRHVSPPAESNHPGMRLEAEISYGIGIFGGRGLITPYGGLGIVDGRSETLAGGRLAMNW